MDDETLEGFPIARTHAKQKLSLVGTTMHRIGLVSTTAEGGELRHRIEPKQSALLNPHESLRFRRWTLRELTGVALLKAGTQRQTDQSRWPPPDPRRRPPSPRCSRS